MASDLTKQALDWLDAQWRMPTRLSTIPQAMNAVGLAQTDPLRWEVAGRLARRWRGRLFQARADAWGAESERLVDFRSQLRSWGFPSIALTTEERMVGRAPVSAAPVPPSAAGIADRLAMTGEAVEVAFDALARVGFLEGRGSGYRLKPGYKRLLRGLGLSFHTVTLADEDDTFNTTCAIDYVVLAKTTYPGRRLRLHDACAQSLAPIHVTYDSDGVIAADPAEPVLYRGGPCAANLLFRSEADLEAWLGAPAPAEKAAPPGTWLARWGRPPR